MADPSPASGFQPVFAMPVIAPSPRGYSDTVANYYVEISTQTAVTPVLVKIGPEQQLPANPLDDKGLRISITNPGAAFVPAVPLSPPADPDAPPLPPPAPFGTLFALMGGWLSFVRAVPSTTAGSAVDLVPILPPPFDALTPAPQYPAPAGLAPATSWGAFLLRLWGVDFQKLVAALPDSPACSAVCYLGVDEASARTALAPLVKLHFPLAAYDASLAVPEKPVLRDVMEGIKGQPYTGSPSYAVLIDDFLDALFDGDTNLLVKGGSAIGEAVRIPDPANSSQMIGRVELWFLDNATPPAFIVPTPLLAGALAYDF
ncbi:MAG: hypothetical protein QOD42_750 [Sphingomonadales bacterium]|jgi:hypothetical protein|nr:hypothetical protein [Sphingomonadales bacterium]